MRWLQHGYYDAEKLVELIDELTEFYETDKHMFFTPPGGTRCKHVFVSALKTDSKDRQLEYSLFRTYDCPKGSNVLEGFQNPHEDKISHAFRATGAAELCTPPWKEPTAKRGLSKCLDIQFPSSHNITELALNEMWGLYGKDMEISVVVNIAPEISNAPDCRNIARRLSWTSKELGSPSLFTWKKLFGAKQLNTNAQKDRSHGETLPAPPVARQTIFGSNRSVGIEEKLRRDEIDSDIRNKLRNVYPEHTPPYYRLVSAPERSAPGTAQKYTSPLKASRHYTTEYVRTRSVQVAMEELGQRIDLGTSEHEKA